jgi:hypothetical protein
MQARHVVVDGSNIATEGSSLPTLKQLDEAVREFLIENPDDVVTVVVDATFGHRIPPEERQLFEEAESGAEIVSPPAGAIGRGDAFLLRVADKVGAVVLSNDSFQEFHGEYEWLFDKGRLIGGKPVPGVGWIFTPRTPVRGPRSRESVKEAKRKKRDESPDAPDESGLDMAAVRSRGRGGERKLQRAIAVAVEEAVEPAKSARKRRRRRRVGELPAEPLNEPLNFITFIAGNQLGDEVEGTVEEFSSHGAFISVGSARCYLPLAGMGDEPPRSAREVLRKGEKRTFVVQAFDAMRRGIELALPGFAHPAGAPTPETVDAEIHHGVVAVEAPAVKSTPARAGAGRRPAKAAGTAKQPGPRGDGARRAKKAAPTKAAPTKTAGPIKTVVPTKTAATKRPAKKAAATAETVPNAVAPAKKPPLQRIPTLAKRAEPARGSVVLKKQGRAKQAAPAKQAAQAKRAAPTKQSAPVKQAAPGRNSVAVKKAAQAKTTAPLKTVVATKKATAAKKVVAPDKVAKQPAQTRLATAKTTTPAGPGRAAMGKQPVAAKVASAKKAPAARRAPRATK